MINIDDVISYKFMLMRNVIDKLSGESVDSAKCKEVVRFVASIDDTLTRQLITERYLLFYTISEIMENHELTRNKVESIIDKGLEVLR